MIVCSLGTEGAWPGHAQVGQDDVQSSVGRQLQRTESADAAEAADYRCRDPIAPANAKYCAALFRTLDRCRRLFGRFTLRCNDNGATACSTSLAQIRSGRCSAFQASLDHPSVLGYTSFSSWVAIFLKSG